MQSHFLQYGTSRIHYLKFGTGTRFLFCFHGYGEDASSFLFLQKTLGKDFTVIAPDLPFHGQTEWNGSLEFRPDDLKEVLNSIVPLDLQTASFLGYSMGGRVALAMMQEIPASVERVVLIAPDGLHKNFWYWLSTHTFAGSKLFSYTMKRPKWFFGGMKVLRKLNLLNKSIFKFAHAYLDDEEERQLLYKRWTSLRRFTPETHRLVSAISQNKIPVRMLFGSYDRIIHSNRSSFIGNKTEMVRVKVIKAGHQLLKEKYAKEISILFYE